MSAPSPLFLAAQAEQRKQAALVLPTEPAKVRPGRVDQQVVRIHDGVVKAKHLEPGMVVRPFVRGVARSSERTVQAVTKVDDGAIVHVEFSSAHVDQDYKAAYRWYCEALDGMPVTETV